MWNKVVGLILSCFAMYTLNRLTAVSSKILAFFFVDHAFLHFRPSLIAAACVCASRICMQISPAWTTQLQLLTCYSWEHLAQCIEMMLM